MFNEQCRWELARPEPSFLAVVESRERGASVRPWANAQASPLKKALLRYGAVLLRDFSCSLDDFAAIGDLFSEVSSDARGQVSPRHQVSGSVYTATDLGEQHSISQHHEMAYDLHPPRYVLFMCKRAPASGGETPVGDARALYKRLTPALVERFAAQGVLYQRNFVPECPGKTARQTFLFDDPKELDVYGAKADIEFEWFDEERLRSRQLRGAVARHPETGDRVFFNLAHVWHWTNMEKAAAAFGPEYSQAVRETAPEDQWYNAFYGDGSSIEEDAIAEIAERHAEEALAIPWREGDVLILDNLLASHGRRAFTSEREVLATIRGPWELPYRPQDKGATA